MDSKEYKFFQWSKLPASLGYAMEGIKVVWQTQQNFRFHVLAAFIAILLGTIFSLDKFEWLILIVVIAGMLVIEIINSAIEVTIDLITEEVHPLAKKAKDMAAGAVVIYAAMSVLIGIIIFFPKIWSLF
ncbi:diacylglycerol kinase family protein [Bacillus spongiae]|uniref:Diacylglycerol kinase family protein n=1 Tax=Bacillus spongiae TaxID=2683610 RepID=A0ABU8H9B1_9BACI